jgi:antirestriction protein
MKNYIEFCKQQFNKTLKPRIYVACLAAYNNGYLHGEWIDASQEVDRLYAEIKKILSNSPIADAEEWAIHDYEGFGNLSIHEYTDMGTIAALASFVIEHGEFGAVVLAHVNGDIDDANRLLEECYHGEHKSEVDFVISFVNEIMTIPDYLSNYVDYEKMARDLFINDFFSIEINHKVHVFSNEQQLLRHTRSCGSW